MGNEETVEKKVKKKCKAGHIILGKSVEDVEIKANNTDKSGNFYIYDLFNSQHKCLALNCYCFVDSIGQPFNKLSKQEEDILNSPTIEVPK